MTPERRDRGGRTGLAVAWIAATMPFVPAVLAFVSHGVPDVLFTGDGAVLELGTFRAAHGVQLVGPYSRFGWSHPGPAYFYLAAPFYEAFHEHGPALNVFALSVDYAAALGVVLLAYRLCGLAFSLLMAALVGVYVLVGAPYLLANEWNPIVPILPLACAAVTAACISRGDAGLWPVFAFVASAIVQTHVGFAPSAVVLAIFAAVGHSGQRSGRTGRAVWITTAVVLTVCWLLPLIEVAVHPPGNLVAIARFFVPKHWAEHSWGEAVRIVVQQMAVVPNAVLQTARARPVTAQRLAGIMLGLQIAALAFVAASWEDAAARSLARLALVELGVAVVAVRAIRGEIEFYLVAWISVIGVTSFAALAAAVLSVVERWAGWTITFIVATAAAVTFMAAALTSPVARSSVVPLRDEADDTLARQVSQYVESAALDQPVIRVEGMKTWPAAAGTLLFLTKRGIAVSAGGDLLRIVGDAFTPSPGPHAELIFDATDAPVPTGAVPIAKAGQVAVYRRG
jgi:hypothetical protein